MEQWNEYFQIIIGIRQLSEQYGMGGEDVENQEMSRENRDDTNIKEDVTEATKKLNNGSRLEVIKLLQKR